MKSSFPNSSFLFWPILMLAGLISHLGCSKPESKDPNQIKLQLNWFPDAQHGGFYTALINGYYEDEGLDVEILPGGPGAEVEAKVDLGRVTFGVANAHRILLKRNQGAKITAVFAAFQKSPRCIMVHEESGIKGFEDLEGVTLAVGSDTAFFKFLQQKVDLKNVKQVTYSGSNAMFLQNKDYCQQAYSISEPILVKRKGANPKTLMLSDLGFNPYTSCLLANESFISRHPEIVRKFVKATQKGWVEYLKNPDAANRRMDELNREHDLDALREGAAASKSLCQPDSQTVIGSMTAERWDELVAQLQSIRMLKEDFDVKGAYSLEFQTD